MVNPYFLFQMRRSPFWVQSKKGSRLNIAVSDLDGDRYSDLIIGSPLHDDGSNADAGVVHLFFGRYGKTMVSLLLMHRLIVGTAAMTPLGCRLSPVILMMIPMKSSLELLMPTKRSWTQVLYRFSLAAVTVNRLGVGFIWNQASQLR